MMSDTRRRVGHYSVSVVIPCHNEVETIPRLQDALARLHLLGKASHEKFEIILVDDGSRDGTAEALESAFGRREGCRIITHTENRGFGAAMRTGFEAARGNIISCYAADCAFPIHDLLTLVNAVREGNDAATATPSPTAGVQGSTSVRLRLLSFGASQAYRMVLGKASASIGTFGCAFRAYRRDAVRTTWFFSDGVAAVAEILARMLIRGLRVVEVPSTVSEHLRGNHGTRGIETTRDHLRLLAKLALWRIRQR